MDWITTSGRTLHEAKSNALDQLGIVADEAEFDVVNDVEKGLFGRVKTEARVRARVRPRQIPEKDERSQRRRGSGSKGGSRRNSKPRESSSQGGGSGQSNDGQSSKGAQSKNQRGGDSQRNSPKSNAGSEKAGPHSEKAQSGNTARNDGAGQSENNNRNKSRNRGGANQAAAAASAAPRREKKAVETEISREDQERIAQEFLEGVLGAFDMSGEVAVAPEPADDGAIEVTVTGQELGLLVGQKGVTLNSLQELTRTVVQRKADGAKTDRLRVDVAGYRARRTAALQEFATKIAHDVVESGNEKLLEPMGPADRKVVHDTVNDIEGVETGSEGEEPRRRVVIRPV